MSSNSLIMGFRCARSGKRFVSVFSRHSPSHRFQFQESREAGPHDVIATPQSPLQATLTRGRDLLKRVGSSLRTKDLQSLLPSGVSGLVRSRGADTSLEASPPRPSGVQVAAESFNVEDLDFAGWCCPLCEHGKYGWSSHKFIHCGKCGEYVCAARVRQVNGTSLFACHDGCGSTGEINGQISAYKGASVAAPSSKQLKGEGQKQLPSSKSSGLVKK